MTFNLEGIFGGIIIVLICLVPIKELKKDYFPLITSALSILLLTVAFKRGQPLFDYVKDLSDETSEMYFKVIFKCFGVATLTQLVSDMCKDFGASGVSEKVNLIGKIVVLMYCMPLVDSLLSLVEELI